MATTAAHFTACKIFVQDRIPRLYILSQEQFLIAADLSDLSTRRTPPWKVRKLSHRMVHIHHSPDNQTLIFLKPDRQQIYTLRLSTSNDRMNNAPPLVPNGKTKSSPKRDGKINIIMRDNATGQFEALLAANEEAVH